MDTPTQTVETPAADPSRISLAAFRSGKSLSESTPVAKTVETPTVVDDAPDPEVEADPELRAAIDEIEAPKPEETPQEKRARTLKHKEAARKGYQTRQANQIARLKRENDELRQRPPAPAGTGDTPVTRAVQPAPTTQAEIDPTDPEPSFDQWAAKNTFEAFAAKHPNHPDPYAGWQAEFGKDWNRWDRRQEQRTADASRRDAARTQQTQRAGEQFTKHRTAGSSAHADFEKNLGALGSVLQGHPAADALVLETVADITDPKVGGEVLYRLGQQIDETRAAIAQGGRALVRLIGRLEAAVTAEAKPAAPASPVVTSAPTPHTPVGATSTGAPQNPASRSGSKLSLKELREWEQAHGRRS